MMRVRVESRHTASTRDMNERWQGSTQILLQGVSVGARPTIDVHLMNSRRNHGIFQVH